MKPLVHLSILLVLSLLACQQESSIRDWDAEQVNNALRQVNENDERFRKTGISFDSIITIAGTRDYLGQTQRVKMKLFFFGENYCRGYYNLSDQEQANLQVFGRRIDNALVLKCVTRINAEEASGYTILDSDLSGIWSNGHINFEKQDISLKKQNIDYQSLAEW